MVRALCEPFEDVFLWWVHCAGYCLPMSLEVQEPRGTGSRKGDCKRWGMRNRPGEMQGQPLQAKCSPAERAQGQGAALRGFQGRGDAGGSEPTRRQH